jgi:predicted dithiol-disulfide oxidoreductase (DUF899 family)
MPEIISGSLNRPYSGRQKEIKLTLYKALIRSVMTYACPVWEFAADTHLMKLQHLQNKILHIISNSRTPARKMQKTFRILHINYYKTKLCRQRAEAIQNHENANVHNIGQGEAQRRKHKKLKPTTVQMTKLPV